MDHEKQFLSESINQLTLIILLDLELDIWNFLQLIQLQKALINFTRTTMFQLAKEKQSLILFVGVVRLLLLYLSVEILRRIFKFIQFIYVHNEKFIQRWSQQIIKIFTLIARAVSSYWSQIYNKRNRFIDTYKRIRNEFAKRSDSKIEMRGEYRLPSYAPIFWKI